MLIGLIGPKQSGKQELAKYLIKTQDFKQLLVSNQKGKNCFKTFSDAVHHATSNWRDRFIIIGVEKYHDFEIAFKRPFFLLVCVQAPTLLRFQRSLSFKSNRFVVGEDEDELTLSSLSITAETRRSADDLEKFLITDEEELYSKHHGNSLYDFIRKASISIFNDGKCLSEFGKNIDALDLTNPEHIRPSWDTYFMALCELASKRSNCMKRRVGCILVSESRVVATGYNGITILTIGTPRNVKNCNEGGCRRCNENMACGSALDHCICMHAEEVKFRFT